MKSSSTARHAHSRSSRRAPGALAAGALVFTLLATASGPWSASAAEAPVGLGTAGSYSVLGGETVTNTGPTTLSGSLGVSPGSAITGFPPGVAAGTINAANAEALQAQSDVGIAYDDAASRALTESVAGDLVGRTLPAGVYNSTGPLALSGTVTLDAQGDPNAVFIFQVASTLITASASTVALIGGASACNVFWQVGSSATLGTASTFKGTILALTSIQVTTSASVEGRALARTGAVTLDNNVFLTNSCGVVPTVPPTATPTVTPTATPTVAPTATPTTPTQQPTVPQPTTPPAGPSDAPGAPIQPGGGPGTGDGTGGSGGAGDGTGGSGGIGDGTGGSGGIGDGASGSTDDTAGGGSTSLGMNRGTNVQTSATAASPLTPFTPIFVGAALLCAVAALGSLKDVAIRRTAGSHRRH